jgi:DNA polymerase-1
VAKKPSHVYLIDGSGFIFRAYHAMPPLTRPDGTPVGAVLGFTNMLLKLRQETESSHFAVVFDVARKTFRDRIYPQYKANRPAPPDDLIPQFALVREATDAFSICRIEQEDFEADDLIATYAREAVKEGAKVTIVSSDKDLMQLVNDKVEMWDPMRERAIRAAEVKEKFGVGPDKVIDVQALCGDSVDNVPGVPGIGVKTAAELINHYGDLETLLKKAGEIKQPKRRQTLLDHAEDARISKKLVTLDDHVKLPAKLSELEAKPIDPERLATFLRAQNFRSLLNRISGKLGEAVKAAPAHAVKESDKEPGPEKQLKPPTPTPSYAPAAKTDHAPAADAASLAKAKQHYELVQDLTHLDRWIAEATALGAVAVDTETTSLDASLAELVGVSLAVEPGRACYIPLGHVAGGGQGALDLGGDAKPHNAKKSETLKQIPLQDALSRLKPLLENESVLKIGQNIKYDIEVFARQEPSIKMAPIDCTMLISFVLAAGLHGHGLDELAKLHFNHDTIKYKDVAGSGKNHTGFAAVALDKARDYAAEDADYTLRLHRLLKPRLLAEHKLAFYETTERAMPTVVSLMESYGIKVDREQLRRASEDFAKRMGELEIEIHKLAGHPFNIASPQQLGKVLFDELKLASGRKTKTGAYGTDADVLEELAAEHALPARVLDWRQLSKLKSTYADALMAQINPATGRVHTSYSLAGAATGRLASTDPNLQNIPVRTEEGRKIRHAFIAEKGHVLLSADYSQIELRLAAHVADVPALKQAFAQGLDIHAATASEVFGVPVKGMDPNLRRRAKAINFGILYGISAFGLASQIDVPQSEASEYIKAYFKRFPGIRDYMEQTKIFAREHGYVETIFGRRCYLRGIKDPNQSVRGFSERAAINAPLQGAAADIIKRAMRRIPHELEKAGLSARMLLQVHDELVFEVAEKEVDETAKLVKRVMEGAALPVVQLSVPLVVDTGHARHWDDAH